MSSYLGMYYLFVADLVVHVLFELLPLVLCVLEPAGQIAHALLDLVLHRLVLSVNKRRLTQLLIREGGYYQYLLKWDRRAEGLLQDMELIPNSSLGVKGCVLESEF